MLVFSMISKYNWIQIINYVFLLLKLTQTEGSHVKRLQDKYTEDQLNSFHKMWHK